MSEAATGTQLTEVDSGLAKSRQLWLFPPPKPLKGRFSGDFFRSLPKGPGVYFFFDDTGRLIYIGKAKNLRQRVGSYRYVHPDRDSRKTWRLVNQVRRIEWRVCESHAEALLLESRLLREHRPRFNRANVWPWSAVYIGLKASDGDVSLKLARELDDEHQWFGAYMASAIYAFSAMRRLLHRRYGDTAVPLNWFGDDLGRSFSMDSSKLDSDVLSEFLQGNSRRFLSNFEKAADTIGHHPLAHQNLVLNDLILLEEFYERGPRRNVLISGKRSSESNLVSPEDLVDWLALGELRREASGWTDRQK